jgi:hypothetical protein
VTEQSDCRVQSKHRVTVGDCNADDPTRPGCGELNAFRSSCPSWPDKERHSNRMSSEQAKQERVRELVDDVLTKLEQIADIDVTKPLPGLVFSSSIVSCTVSYLKDLGLTAIPFDEDISHSPLLLYERFCSQC